MPTPDQIPPDQNAPRLPAPLLHCRDAEDYFRLLEVDYDERVLNVGRLHILRLFAAELAAGSLPADDQQRRGHEEPEDDEGLGVYRAALQRAYQALVDDGPLQHRVFKVLRDRAPVPLREQP